MKRKIKITEATLSRIMERMLTEQESPEENDVFDDLKKVLVTWENKEYSSDESRWKEYYKDIENLLKKYEVN